MSLFRSFSWIILFFITASLITNFAWSIPASMRQDYEEERRKVLKAADSLEILYKNMDKLRVEIQKLKKDNNLLKKKVMNLETNKKTMVSTLKYLKEGRKKERKEIIKEFEKIIDGEVSSPKKKKKWKKKKKSSWDGEVYPHKVEKGQSLIMVLRAYQKETGTKATMRDLLRANNIKIKQHIRPGQIIFIPKK